MAGFVVALALSRSFPRTASLLSPLLALVALKWWASHVTETHPHQSQVATSLAHLRVVRHGRVEMGGDLISLVQAKVSFPETVAAQGEVRR